MRNAILFLSVFLILMVPGFLVQAEESVSYPCYRLSSEPILDGRLSEDSGWENIPAATGFVKLDKALVIASKQTSFKIGYTQKALYIGVECEETEVDKIKAGLKDMGSLWKEDSVEVFIFPEGAENYYQFTVNAIGSRWNGIRSKIGEKRGSQSLWDWQAKTYRGKDYYSIEIRVPFENFGRTPKNKEVWAGNICRNILTSGDRLTAWAHQIGTFHCPNRFGNIVFEDRSISSKEAKRIENNFLSFVKNLFKKKIEKNLKLFSNYQSELSEATENPSFTEEISSVLKGYGEIKEQAASLDLDSLSLKEISLLSEKSRRVLLEADELERKILLEADESKGKNLLNALFE